MVLYLMALLVVAVSFRLVMDGITQVLDILNEDSKPVPVWVVYTDPVNDQINTFNPEEMDA
jgi:hypothetical protein